MHKLSEIKEYAQMNLDGNHGYTVREAIQLAIEELDTEAAKYAAQIEQDEWHDFYGHNLEMSNYELY